MKSVVDIGVKFISLHIDITWHGGPPTEGNPFNITNKHTHKHANTGILNVKWCTCIVLRSMGLAIMELYPGAIMSLTGSANIMCISFLWQRGFIGLILEFSIRDSLS